MSMMRRVMRTTRVVSILFVLSLIGALQGCAALVVAGGATAVMSATDRRTVGAQLDDQNIELKAGVALRADKTLTDIHINVTSFNGVVLLTGEAPSAEQRDKVLTTVRDVPGARRTVNEIRIAPMSEVGYRTNDSWLTTKVKTRLIGVQDLDSSHVKVITENSVVYLMGLVKKQEADAATGAAAEVSGVDRIVKLFEYLD